MSKSKPQKAVKSAPVLKKTSKITSKTAKPKTITKKSPTPKLNPLKLENQLIAKIEQKLTDQIAAVESPSQIGFLPVRLSFILNAIYFLAFSAIALIASTNGIAAISPWLTLPVDQSLSTTYLLEISGVFGMIVAILMLMAAQTPKQYLWFYLLMILLIQPANLISNFTKMQFESTLMFQNYLFFDTVFVAVLWALNLLSFKAFWKIIQLKK